MRALGVDKYFHRLTGCIKRIRERRDLHAFSFVKQPFIKSGNVFRHVFRKRFLALVKRGIILVFRKIDGEISFRRQPEHQRTQIFAVDLVVDQLAHQERIHLIGRGNVDGFHERGLSATKQFDCYGKQQRNGAERHSPDQRPIEDAFQHASLKLKIERDAGRDAIAASVGIALHQLLGGKRQHVSFLYDRNIVFVLFGFLTARIDLASVQTVGNGDLSGIPQNIRLPAEPERVEREIPLFFERGTQQIVSDCIGARLSADKPFAAQIIT